MTALTAGSALALTLLMPPTYSAHATNFVRLDTKQNSTLYQNSQFALNRVQSYTALAQSPRVLDPVIQKLHLTIKPRALGKQVSATNPTGTVLIEVSASSGSAALARDIANAVSDQLATVVESLETGPSRETSPVTVTR